MHYSEKPGMCRVDFFKESGKWYTTEEIDFSAHYEKHPSQALKDALSEQIGQRLRGMYAVCLEPYSEHEFPVMIKWDGVKTDVTEG